MIEVHLSHEHICAIKRALNIRLTRLHKELRKLQGGWAATGFERALLKHQIDWFQAALDQIDGGKEESR